jgi:hypothetical protein
MGSLKGSLPRFMPSTAAYISCSESSSTWVLFTCACGVAADADRRRRRPDAAQRTV